MAMILPAPISPQEALEWAPKHAWRYSTPEQLALVADYLYLREYTKAARELFGAVSKSHGMTFGFPLELVEEARAILADISAKQHAAHAVAAPYLA